MSLHAKKGLGKKDKKGWHCDKILIHLKKFAPPLTIFYFFDFCGSRKSPFNVFHGCMILA
jgi:hypothetical protein